MVSFHLHIQAKRCVFWLTFSTRPDVSPCTVLRYIDLFMIWSVGAVDAGRGWTPLECFAAKRRSTLADVCCFGCFEDMLLGLLPRMYTETMGASILYFSVFVRIVPTCYWNSHTFSNSLRTNTHWTLFDCTYFQKTDMCMCFTHAYAQTHLFLQKRTRSRGMHISKDIYNYTNTRIPFT